MPFVEGEGGAARFDAADVDNENVGESLSFRNQIA